jgi:hypothetical protein
VIEMSLAIQVVMIPTHKMVYHALVPASVRLLLYPYLVAIAQVLLNPFLYIVIVMSFLLERLILAPKNQKMLAVEMIQDFCWFLLQSVLFVTIITIYSSLCLEYLPIFDAVDGMATWPVATIIGFTMGFVLLDILVAGTTVLVFAELLPRSIDWVFKRLEHQLGSIGRRRSWAVALIFVLVIALRVALLPVVAVQEPRVHDEFSYLLAADTFASGRLTNPPHPMWIHFESFHINHKPTYQSMYPIGQGLVLGIAQRITRHPWFGVLFSTAAMCAAICWMLQGWMSPSWALFGALLAVLKYCGNHYWMNSYWGGAVAGLGGALVLGAMPRIMQTHRVRDSLLLGIGVAILANSRPYEGLVLTIAVGIALLAWCIQRRPGAKIVLKRGVVPAGIVLLLAAAGMMFYFWRVTNNPLVMPYQVNLQQYVVTPPFIWQKLGPIPHYNHQVMRQFSLHSEMKMWSLSRTVAGFVTITVNKLKIYYIRFVWPLLILLLVGSYHLGKRSRGRCLPLILLVFLLGLLGETWGFAHYAAPAAALVIGILVFGLRCIRSWSRRARFGLRLSRAVMLVVMLLFLRGVWGISYLAATPHFPEPWHLARARIKNQLEHMPGQHLIIIRYAIWHSYHEEWVYNAADIDRSKVVFARDMGPAQNQELFNYFKERRTWLVNADEFIPRLEPYEPSSADRILSGGVASQPSAHVFPRGTRMADGNPHALVRRPPPPGIFAHRLGPRELLRHRLRHARWDLCPGLHPRARCC